MDKKRFVPGWVFAVVGVMVLGGGLYSLYSLAVRWTETDVVPSFTTVASASPMSVQRGQSTNLTITVTSHQPITALVDVEIWAPGNNRLFVYWWDYQQFQAGETRQFTTTWNVPPDAYPGTLPLSVNIFDPGDWNPQYHSNDAGTVTVTAAPVALGVYHPQAPFVPADIDAFASLVGDAPNAIMWYQLWGDGWGHRFLPGLVNPVAERGMMPMITWEPWAGAGRDEAQYALRTIVAGQHDALIRGFARGAAAWGKPYYLRFAHEMNGKWYPWSPGVNGNTATEFVQAWRHLVDIFRQEGATNTRFVWCPNAHWGGGPAYPDIYPGDAYVDWICLDGYNWSGTQYGEWRSFTQVFKSSYDEITALSAKPLMIGETASAERHAEEKAAWIRQAMLTDVPHSFPRVKAFIWFDEPAPEDRAVDWRVNSSPSALEAFREVAQSALYQGALP